MYQPSYQITDKLLASIVKIEVAKAKSEAVSLNYDLRSKAAQRVKAQNLFHIANMLNLNFTLRDAEKLAEGRKFELDDPRYTLLTNFRNILEFNRSGVADTYTNLDANILLNINKMIASGWKSGAEVRLRGNGDSLDGQFEGWINYRDHDIQSPEIVALLNELMDWFQAEQKVHSLIKVAILTWRMVELMPFLVGNKYTLLAVLDLLTHQYGYTSTTYTALMQNFDNHEQEYWKAWDVLQRSHDLTGWIEKFISSLADTVSESFHSIDTMVSEQEEKNTSQPFLDLNKRQLKILRYLQNIPTVKRDDYCQMMDVSTMTAYRDMNDLVEKKLLKVEGQGRGTRYKLASR